MSLDTPLINTAKKAGLKITETPDKLNIKPYLGFKHQMNTSGIVLTSMGLVCLIGINVKPHTDLAAKITISCLALLFTGIGVALLAMHATAFVTAGPGRLAYRHKFKWAQLAIDHNTIFTIRQETKISRSIQSSQTHVYLITQILVKQVDNEQCITEYWLNKNAGTEKTSLQLAHSLVASLKSKAGMQRYKE